MVRIRKQTFSPDWFPNFGKQPSFNTYCSKELDRKCWRRCPELLGLHSVNTKLMPTQVVKQWNKLSGEIVDVLSLKTFKAEWGSQQADLVKGEPTQGGWDLMMIGSLPNHSMTTPIYKSWCEMRYYLHFLALHMWAALKSFCLEKATASHATQ